MHCLMIVFNFMESIKQQQGNKSSSNVGLILAASFGLAGVGLVAVATPFILPALRKHCLPYVPATENQLRNLSLAFKKHSNRGNKFLDIGSGDGRICRLASQINIFSEVHGVELNGLLVNYSRFQNFKSKPPIRVKYFHKNLWKFPIHSYDSVCIFGVESMMDPLKEYLIETNQKRQILYACRFPFEGLKQLDEIGNSIDTVWVYEINCNQAKIAS